MSIADVLTAAAAGAGSGGTVVALINAVFNRGGKRAEAAKTESATFREEANDLYAKVKQECADCKQELHAAEQRHNKAIGKLQSEVGELREALVKSLNTVDELLPYTQGLPDQKMREIQARNRAVRRAVWVQP